MKIFIVALGIVYPVHGISCYSCTFNFNDVYDSEDGWCANDTLLEKPKNQVIRPCAPWEKECITTVTTTLNSFTSITRGCAVQCPELCDSDGYGQHQVTCAKCCKHSSCNNDTGVTYYLGVMEKQYTFWTKALPDEIKFNRENKIKFPY
ncbi:unnamed protein product [Bursaphelenchus xylophilus]|uniref:(pine wood nematode) hypothetical protein n=1 Tax=Bursaphelenchus xylophilus TaxID=6326 RepID=A0A1I7SMS5_BURXY|nr:unnamed protein product [Bursaphelenchus xylophilus]CAG9130345.1 unnamed protein product [Bursaphelenchus xylophilus]